MLLGMLILMNLMVAILLDGRQTARELIDRRVHDQEDLIRCIGFSRSFGVQRSSGHALVQRCPLTCSADAQLKRLPFSLDLHLVHTFS